MRIAIFLVEKLREGAKFARAQPKRVEAAGLFLILFGAFLQLTADHYQAIDNECRNKELIGEISFTRSQIMALVECSKNAACNDWNRTDVKPEADCFVPIGIGADIKFWQLMRLGIFTLGSLMVLLSKWLDSKPIPERPPA